VLAALEVEILEAFDHVFLANEVLALAPLAVRAGGFRQIVTLFAKERDAKVLVAQERGASLLVAKSLADFHRLCFLTDRSIQSSVEFLGWCPILEFAILVQSQGMLQPAPQAS